MLHIALNDDSGYCNKISLSQQGLRRFTKAVPKVISITHAHSKERRRVERFIESTFANSYQARITKHYPMLMSVRDADDNILAALGFRPAQKEGLFLEQYFDVPIEQVLAERVSQTIFREDVVEVGNLAAVTKGASIFLFITLNAWLKQQGYKTVTLTATQGLKRFFSLLKLDLMLLGEADPTRLADGGKQWGSYYETKPRIWAGSILQTDARMYEVLNFHLAESCCQLYSRLHHEDQNKGLINE